MAAKFEVEGFDDLMKALETLGKKTKAAEERALQAGATPIFDSAYKKAPVDTGKGRDSIKIGRTFSRRGIRMISVGVHSADFGTGRHMYFQEFGTTRHPAQPFLRPAKIEKEKEAVDRMKESLRGDLGL